jgi:S1-C subfamily serine protease
VYGQVIGIDTAASSSYQFQGQSGQGTEQAYSIPIDEALSIGRQIQSGTTTSDIHIGATAFLGLEIAASSSGGFGGAGGPGGQGSDGSASGVIIIGTLSGSPASGAGLTAGDTITAVGGQSVSTAEQIAQALIKYHPGNSVSISWVDSFGQSHTATLTLASGPAA